MWCFSSSSSSCIKDPELPRNVVPRNKFTIMLIEVEVYFKPIYQFFTRLINDITWFQYLQKSKAPFLSNDYFFISILYVNMLIFNGRLSPENCHDLLSRGEWRTGGWKINFIIKKVGFFTLSCGTLKWPWNIVNLWYHHVKVDAK